jgi:CheY-like chemotaxis protein
MLAVSDTGIGMDEETRARAFEPFFTTKPAGKGTGLGLAGAYGTVRRSNGSISIYSEPGKGTTVRIYLPETDQAPVMQADRRTEVPASGQGQVVLVVEDRAEIREVLATQLRDLGYRPTLVANGGEAVLAVEEEGLRPDVMLTDVVMPGMGGAVLAERLRRSLPGLKVLFMSGYTDNAIVHHGILDEGVPFIAKPFTKDALGTALAGIVYGALPGTAEGVGRVALLVDDDPYVAEITELALRRRGYTVISARSRQAALDALAGPGFDLVLMDVNVPPASGEQILRDMRDAGCNVPAIMHTGAAETVDLNALRNLGVIGVISKTGNLRAMADEIEALLSNQSDGWRTSADEQEESER